MNNKESTTGKSKDAKKIEDIFSDDEIKDYVRNNLDIGDIFTWEEILEYVNN